MLYIHQLTHLSSKMADLESVYLVRELREKVKLPLREEVMEEAFCEFFVSSSELQLIEETAALVGPTIEMIKSLAQLESELYEAVSLQRAIQALDPVTAALESNLAYLQQIQVWQATSASGMTTLLNQIPKLRIQEEKIRVNDEIKGLFQFLLRNQGFVFHAPDMVNEGPVAQVNGLVESMQKGFFFHSTLEEEYKKVDFATIKRRIPAEELKRVGEIEQNIIKIKKGADTAYNANMRMVNLSVILYSYVKWLSNK
ncbi:hypothetical protein HY494_02665 [Candidatus Woesearchaeota archaeon]|nr:hypothetical protein [Candidatus Woesearchaeota archaeon]